MHLTNYSVNKHNEHFERDETENKGSKRSIKWFTEFLQANQHDVAKFWSDISVRLYHFIILIVSLSSYYLKGSSTILNKESIILDWADVVYFNEESEVCHK